MLVPVAATPASPIRCLRTQKWATQASPLQGIRRRVTHAVNVSDHRAWITLVEDMPTSQSEATALFIEGGGVVNDLSE